MSTFLAPFVALIVRRDHARFELPEPPRRGAAPRRFLTLAAGVLLSLAGPWHAAAEAQTTGVGSAGVTFASGASARGAATLTVGDAVRGPRGTAPREHQLVEGEEVSFTIQRYPPIATFDVVCYYTISETGDMVSDGDEGTKTVIVPANEETYPLPLVPTVDDAVHEPDSMVKARLPTVAEIPDQGCPPVPEGAQRTHTVLDNDAPTVSIGEPAAVAVEGETLSFPITLDGPGYQDVTLVYEFAGTAGADDYAPSGGGTLIIPAGETRAAIELRTLVDGLAEVDESVDATIADIRPLRSATPGTTTATGWIADNDGTPAVRVADATAAEDESLFFEVTLSPASSWAVTVEYAITPDTAQPADYAGPTSGTVTFAPGQITQEVELALVDDVLAEEDETVTLALSDVHGGTLVDDTAIGTIVDNDGPPAVTVRDATAAEDESLFFEVTLSPASSWEVSVQYAITPDTAQAADYTGPTSGTVTFAPGQASREVELALVDDALAEDDETVTLALSGVQGGTLADGVALGMIVDNDGPPAVMVGDATAAEGEGSLVFPVTLSPASSREVTVEYDFSPGTATENADYTGPTSGAVTFEPGETEKEIALALVDDALAEDDETVTLALSGVRGGTLADGVATGTITDDDGTPAVRVADATAAEGEGSLVFAVTLSPASSREVTVEYEFSPGTATENADYAGPTAGAVTFAPGQTGKEIALALVDDALAEDDETVTLALSGPQGGATLADGVATGTIIDNDGVPAVAVGDAAAAEDTSLVFAVTLSPASSRAVSVRYAITPETAQSADYTGPTSGAVTFSPGQTAKEVVLDLVDDEIAEDDETVTLALSGPQGGATLADEVATGTIIDNDGAPAVAVGDAAAAEGDGRLVFVVTLIPASSREVTVDYDFSPGTATENADYSGPFSGTLTFAPGETAKEVALELVDDEIAEDDETVTLALSDPRGATLAGAAATGTIRDDDLPRVTVAAEAGEVAEGGDAVFVLTRAGATTETLTVAFAVTGGDSVLASPPPTEATFEAGAASARVTLATEDDGTDESDGTVTLTLAGGAAYEPGEPSRASVVVRDDDYPPEASVVDAAAVAEGGTLAFPVRLSRPVDAAVTVDYALAGTATAGADYEDPASGSVTFARGETEKTIIVATLDDERDEPDETVEVALSDGDAYDLGVSRAEGVILDDRDPPDASVGDAMAVAEGGALAFPVSLSRPVDAAVTVDYVLAGMATAGEDYEGPAAGSVTFAPGETEKTIIVVTVDDERDESDETVEVTLADGDAHDLGAAHAAGVIQDDDETPEVSVCDAAAVPEGGTLTFPVRLSRPSGAAVTVDYVLAGTATAGDDYEGPAAGSVTFAPGETEKTILVATVDDERDEPDETVEVTLADGAVHDLGAARTAGVILDDDDPPSVTVSAAAERVAEGEAAVFVLRRTGDASEALTVELAVSELGGDMVPAGSEGSRRATFEAGATTATLAVATGSDGVAGPDSEVTATLAGGDGYAVGRPDSATVAVSDGGGESLLAEGRRLGAASLLRRHVQRFSQLTSVAALAALEGGPPPSTANLRADGDGVAASGDFGLDLPSGWNGWGSVRYSKLTEATDGGVRDFYAGGSRPGADGRSAYGALVGYESAPVTSRGVRLEAAHAQLGLYGARRFGGALTLDGALGWGRGDHDLSLVGGPYPVDATHRSTRLVARGDLTGDFGWGTAGLRIEPQLGLLYAEEDLDAFTDSLGGVAPGERLWLARLGFGPKLTWRRGIGATRARLRVNFDAHNLGPSGEDMEEVSAELELGHRRQLGARGGLDLSAGVDGLGSDWFSSTSFGLTYEGAF